MNRRALVASSVVCGAVALSPVARADDDTYLNVGLLLSFPIEAPAAHVGVGVEASFQRYPDRGVVGVGGFLQAQYLLGGGWRVDGGAQGSATILGAELGLALVAPHANDPYLGLHTSFYGSFGYVGMAIRWTPRLVGTAPITHEISLAPTAKLWWHIDDGGTFRLWEIPCGNLISTCGATVGRPLMVDGAAVRPPARGGHTDDAAWWIRAMTEEYAAVAAFARVSLSLMALGAPPDLVARTHRAALDEVDHARRCAAVAAHLGASVEPGPFPEALAPMPAADLASLAVSTTLEGCIGEGAAALDALRALERAEGPARDALAVIARDEAEHARLAWDTVAWCCQAGGEAVRSRVVAALLAHPAAPRRSPLAWSLRRARRRAKAHPRAYATAG